MFEKFKSNNQINKELTDFISQVEDIVKIIKDYVNENNQKDAFAWFAQLLSHQVMWQREARQLGGVVIYKDFTTGDKIVADTVATKKLDAYRAEIVNHAVTHVEKIFAAKRWQYEVRRAA